MQPRSKTTGSDKDRMRKQDSEARKILGNLDLFPDKPSIESVEDGIAWLAGRQDDLAAIHIWFELPDASCFRKKEYFHVRKYERMTKLDEWIHQNLIDNEEYGRYLDQYRSQRDRLKFENIDEYIMNRHYRSRAIASLKKRKRNFKMEDWTRPRRGLDYERRSGLVLKNGSEYRFDFRSPLETLFILRENGLKKILAAGGFGGSGRRLDYTLFTAVFYLLAKKRPILHHLILYDRFNRFKFVRSYARPLVAAWLGMNYPLDQKLISEIRKTGVDFSSVQKKWKYDMHCSS